MRKEYLSIVTRGYDTPELKDKHSELFIAVNELRELSKQYDAAEKAAGPTDKFIVDMVEKYINIIIPIATEIRNLTYVHSGIEHTTIKDNNSTLDVNKLIQEPYTINELYITGQPPKIVNNSSG